jgi:hypothetical protein
LWQAFEADTAPVLLIDEIDKADIEFPNDLLRELDQMEFFVHETQQFVRARQRPIIIITSNNERNCRTLSAPLLLSLHPLPDRKPCRPSSTCTTLACSSSWSARHWRFFAIRELPGLKKKPTTSELLDWLKLLGSEGIDSDELAERHGNASLPPLAGALLKNEQDMSCSSAWQYGRCAVAETHARCSRLCRPTAPAGKSPHTLDAYLRPARPANPAGRA